MLSRSLASVLCIVDIHRWRNRGQLVLDNTMYNQWRCVWCGETSWRPRTAERHEVEAQKALQVEILNEQFEKGLLMPNEVVAYLLTCIIIVIGARLLRLFLLDIIRHFRKTP